MTELEKCLENATKPKTANKRRHTKHENRSESWRNSNTQKHETTIINAHHEIIFGFAWNFRLHYGAPISKSDSFFPTYGFRLTVEVLSALCLAHGFFVRKYSPSFPTLKCFHLIVWQRSLSDHDSMCYWATTKRVHTTHAICYWFSVWNIHDSPKTP